jgi:hypothetical protein
MNIVEDGNVHGLSINRVRDDFCRRRPSTSSIISAKVVSDPIYRIISAKVVSDPIY